jgi:hypothetical protein
MKLTNRLNLPQALVSAIENDSYTRGNAEISVTGLLAPPRKVEIERMHADEVIEDASDRIWSLLGQSIHTILERASKEGIAERRLTTEVEGWKVSGAMDCYYPEKGLLQDYKTVTAYKFKNGQAPMEYEQQLNLYAALLRRNGDPVSGLEIVGILRDWSKMEARRDPAYPQAQVVVVPVTVWPAEQAEAFLRERVILHRQARVELPECTVEERWQKPTLYAVMKAGQKRSLKNYTSREEAEEHASRVGAKVVERPGESIRCQAYCNASSFCTQFRAEVQRDSEEVA